MNKICWQNYTQVTKYHSQVGKHVCLLFYLRTKEDAFVCHLKDSSLKWK